MSVVIDASIWVASVRPSEQHHAASRQFLQSIGDNAVDVYCPSLVLPECMAAIARPTGDATLADALVHKLESFPRLSLISLTLDQAHRAAVIARDCRLRGADSVYVATADYAKAYLVTWDVEVVTRCGSLIQAMTPDDWLRTH
jgi:predicted nucleic acid-binding protein